MRAAWRHPSFLAVWIAAYAVFLMDRWSKAWAVSVLSIIHSKLLFGDWYTGISPDVLFSVFGMATNVTSRDPLFNDVLKLKGGAEITYLFLSWMAFSTRVDHVRLDNDDSRKAFSIFTGRLLFHTGWRSRDEISLQYSYFDYGSEVYVKTGFPPVTNPTINPDRQVLSLTGTFWW